MQEYALDYTESPKYEIINGKTYLMAGTSDDHDKVLGNIRFVFERFLRGKTCQIRGENINVQFDEESPKVMPDLKIVCDRSKIKKNGIKGAPDLIIEILSSRTKTRDETIKKDLYEKHGVREYWIVDTKYKTVEVYILKEGKFIKDYTYQKFDEDDIKDIETMGTEYEKERLKVNTIKTSLYGDDLIISINDIFYDMIED